VARVQFSLLLFIFFISQLFTNIFSQTKLKCLKEIVGLVDIRSPIALTVRRIYHMHIIYLFAVICGIFVLFIYIYFLIFLYIPDEVFFFFFFFCFNS
jgi:hypothetical protein